MINCKEEKKPVSNLKIKPFQVVAEVKLINDRLKLLLQQKSQNDIKENDCEIEIGILLSNTVTLLSQINEEFYDTCLDKSIIDKLIDLFVELPSIQHILLLYFERCIISKKYSANIYEELIEILPVLTIILKTQNLKAICSVNTFIMSFVIIYSSQICQQQEIKQLTGLTKQKAMLQLAEICKNKQISDSKYLQQVIEQNRKINKLLMYKSK